MRTTINIDDDVLQAVREIAEQDGISMGEALSRLARESLTHPMKSTARNGVPLFPRKEDGEIVSLELVNQLRDESI